MYETKFDLLNQITRQLRMSRVVRRHRNLIFELKYPLVNAPKLWLDIHIAEHKRTFLTILVRSIFAILISAFFASGANGETWQNKLRAAYLSSAFGFSRYGVEQKIVKPSISIPIPVYVYCPTIECRTGLPENLKYLSNKFFSESKQETSNVLIAFYRNDEDLKNIVVDATMDNGQKVFSEGSHDCLLVVKASGPSIDSIQIFVSLEQEPQRSQACVVIQMFRGVGLALPNDKPFEYLWSEGEFALKKSTGKDLEHFFKSVVALLGIHLCKDIRAGESRDEIIATSEKTEQCINSVLAEK
jgi:hypothetical protein